MRKLTKEEMVVLKQELEELKEDYELNEIGLGVDSDGIISWYTSNHHDISEGHICNANENWEEEIKNYNGNLKFE